MDVLRISKIDDVYIQVDCESSIKYELDDKFKFMIPNARFHPMVKNKVWSGEIHLFNIMSGRIYAGLLPEIVEFAKTRDYEIEYEDDFSDDSFSVKEAEDFIRSLKLPTQYEVRDYQLEAFIHAVRKRRALLLSPTGSGKSLIQYLLTRYYNEKTLIVVPTVNLVNQLKSDFLDYGFDDPDDIHCIYTGQLKQVKSSIVISTWQSLQRIEKKYFDQYKLIIGDECHTFKAKSLTEIMSKLTDAPYRFGVTGSLDDSLTNKMVLEGLFGKIRQVAKTKELMDRGYLSKLLIKVLVLNYVDETRKTAKKFTYQEEIDFLVKNTARNKFTKNLALSLEGNTLLLFQYVEKHGKILYDIIQRETNRPVYFIYGGTDVEDREKIRKLVDTLENSIIIASSGTFSAGINIKNINNIIFSSPSKAKIKTLQSIGRGLRVSPTKTEMTLFDIADDLSWKKHENYTLEHLKERLRIYSEENFDYKLYKINIGV